VGACIEGDKIRVQCMKGGKWKVRSRSGQHKGHFLVAEKDQPFQGSALTFFSA